MQADINAGNPAGEASRTGIGTKIYAIGVTLADLDPGPLADLRRLSLDGDNHSAPYFWRLASRHKLSGPDLVTWARIVRIMAILTQKGRDDQKRSPHEAKAKLNGWRGLGTALCDGGDRTWPGSREAPRPVFSEQRLARLLAAKGETRAELMERAVRMLAAKKSADAGLDCVGLARFLLFPDDPQHARDIARDYYARFDRAQHDATDDDATDSSGDDQ